ncbi:MAG: class I SAM-dependent methyltransferase [Acidobacteriota bacterium]|nr:class I SAM-dependent methyltransferase [Acidobacteriota bacterium]MDH3786440.1 class I SAM-dependent methyltransferase [Acidobacteriota bacterium]
MSDGFQDGPLRDAIAAQAEKLALPLGERPLGQLVRHARAVHDDDHLHLTSITDADLFVRRHLGESLVGAQFIEPGTAGVHLDMGTGNGYPGLVMQLVRPELDSWLVEASKKKSTFLQGMVDGLELPRTQIVDRQVQRLDDLRAHGFDEKIRVLTTRAMGGWERIVPRLASAMDADGQLLLWAGEEVETVRKRSVWQRFTLDRKFALPDRDQSWLWLFRVAPSVC